MKGSGESSQSRGSLAPKASILHVDMDSFFVSVELLTRPELLGLAVAVAHDSPRSVITSASYEARRFGVRSAMPVTRAKQLCPHLTLIAPDHRKYRIASREVMRIFREFTPLVEPLSIDEAFLDVGGSLKLFGSPRDIANELRARVREQTGLPASVGIAATKFVAKLASGRAKPDGVLEITPEQTIPFLHALPVDAMWGVGRVTAEKLRSRAIHTVKELAVEPLESLERIVGQAVAHHLHELANGRDPRTVEVERTEKSIGHEETFERDLTRRTDLDRELLKLSSGVAHRLRAQDFAARTVSLKVRWSSFDTVSRSRTLGEPTNVTKRIFETAKELLTATGYPAEPDAHGRPVRLIGVRGEQLVPATDIETGLWSDDERDRALDETLDRLGERFGRGQVRPARLIE